MKLPQILLIGLGIVIVARQQSSSPYSRRQPTRDETTAEITMSKTATPTEALPSIHPIRRLLL